MKKIRFGLMALAVAICGALISKANTRQTTDYYQFYLNESGEPAIYVGASDLLLLSGCKVGALPCGKIYMADDVYETSPGSGEYSVIPGHENNEVIAFNKAE